VEDDFFLADAMTFFFFALGFMWGGRKLGWALSRALLYNAPVAVAVTLSLAWGIVVAGAMRAVLNWQEPGAVLRWIMGYALAAYVAIPNFGLLVESSIPGDATRRHALVSNLPLITYITVAVVFAFAIPY
jgi:hypothetical protein